MRSTITLEDDQLFVTINGQKIKAEDAKFGNAENREILFRRARAFLDGGGSMVLLDGSISPPDRERRRRERQTRKFGRSMQMLSSLGKLGHDGHDGIIRKDGLRGFKGTIGKSTIGVRDGRPGREA